MRKSERIAVDEAARLHPNDWSSLEVRLVDCSAEGFRAACEARVLIGNQVTLELPGLGPVRAWVTWVGEGEFGARFLEPIDIQRVGLAPAPDEAVLARLLVQRAAAHRACLWDEENTLKARIRERLPLRRG